MEQFLKPTEVIDWVHPAVSSKARELVPGLGKPKRTQNARGIEGE